LASKKPYVKIAQGENFKIGGIRVVKQPNSNLTYLQSYPTSAQQGNR